MNNEKGVSLVESLLVMVVVTAIVFLVANLPNAINLINKSKNLSLAKEIASKQIEDKRAISYSNLVPDPSPIPISDTRISLLPQGSGTVLVEECDLNICKNSEQVKHVKVTVTFKENSKTQTINLETFIGEGGLNQ